MVPYYLDYSIRYQDSLSHVLSSNTINRTLISISSDRGGVRSSGLGVKEHISRVKFNANVIRGTAIGTGAVDGEGLMRHELLLSLSLSQCAVLQKNTSSRTKQAFHKQGNLYSGMLGTAATTCTAYQGYCGRNKYDVE